MVIFNSYVKLPEGSFFKKKGLICPRREFWAMATGHQNFGKSPPPVHQLQGFDQAAPVARAFEKSLVKGDAQEPDHADGDDTHLV